MAVRRIHLEGDSKDDADAVPIGDRCAHGADAR